MTPFAIHVELVFRAVPEHVEKCTQSHLLLILKRLQEQQGVIVNLHEKVGNLEQTTALLTTNLAVLDAAVAAQATMIQNADKRIMKHIQDEVQALDKKTSKSSAALQTELNTVKSNLQQLLQAQNKK